MKLKQFSIDVFVRFIIFKSMPKYIYNLIPLKNTAYDTGFTYSVGTYCCRFL